jgi:hypothetical protein
MKLAINIILSLALIAFWAVYLHGHIYEWPNGDTPVLPGPPAQDYEKVKERKTYHGALVARMDTEGDWWFYREDKRCKLW